ncbi:MAG: type II toxin-antitoxin system VapC family toxin [Cyanobacteria bacterium CRU_2_1]|nr:type II toxin-antitoxin system VapC family toxin [Cyanobacteria bacterium RU_5_0]NJR63468.1 type II toxin-antitoxin system VapC family toxin [Cyanobacteria bacterium CRU_2_1]
MYFIDTSYLLALELANDQNHQAAQSHWKSLLMSAPALVTTSYVLSETITYLNSRSYHTRAIRVGNSLLSSPSVQFVHVDESLFYAGWNYFQQHQDKTYSLTDCISFIVMQQYN